MAAKLSAGDREALAGGWARAAESLTLAIDLSSGLQAVATIAAGTVAGVASTRDYVIAGLTELAARLDEHGVEHRRRERARVGFGDGVVAAELVLDQDELRAIRSTIGEQIRGRGPL